MCPVLNFLSDRGTLKVGTFTIQFAETRHTHNHTKVHGICHQPNCILGRRGKPAATQHLPSLKSMSPTGIVPTAWWMGNQTSESMVGSPYSFSQDCLIPGAGVGSRAPIHEATLQHRLEMFGVASRCQVSGQRAGRRSASHRGLAVSQSPTNCHY